MTGIQKYFLSVAVSFTIIYLTVVTFANLYIWQESGEIALVFKYNLTVFLGMALSSIFAGIISMRLGSKFVLLISGLLFTINLSALIMLETEILDVIKYVGFISGFALGTYFFSIKDLTQRIITEDVKEKYTGFETAFSNLLALILIPTIAYTITITHSYQLLFVVSLVLTLLLTYLSLFIRVPFKQDPILGTREMLRGLIRYDDMHHFLMINFFYGIQDGLYWVLLGIVTLEFFGSLTLWGVFTASMRALVIILALLYGKGIRNEYRRVLIGVVTILFSASAIILAQNWNIMYFVIYQVLLVLLTVVLTSTISSLLGDIISESDQLSQMRHQYNSLGGVVTNTGRLLPVLVLLLLNVTVIDNLVLRFAFLAVAPVPFILSVLISKTRPAKEDLNEPELVA